MGLKSLLSTRHELREIEVEVTSRCNARCVHCPHTRRTTGLDLDRPTFDLLCERYATYFERAGKSRVVMSFAGSGEPLLNRQLEYFVRKASALGVVPTIISNAALLTPQRAQSLVDAGLEALYVSCQGIESQAYRESQGLDFEKVLAHILGARPILAGAGVKLEIQYNDLPTIRSTPDEVVAFWSQHDLTVRGPYPIWNRGGNLTDFERIHRADGVTKVNFDLPAWCPVPKFHDTITADGTFLRCMCDYFGESPGLGTLEASSIEEIHRIYEQTLKAKAANEICTQCVKSGTKFLLAELVTRSPP